MFDNLQKQIKKFTFAVEFLKRKNMYFDTTTAKDIDVFFREYNTRNQHKKTLKDLKGKVLFREDYNYKTMRETQ